MAHTGDPPVNLGSMPLYVNLQRVYNELRELGASGNSPLSAEQLFAFDQIHYKGTDAVRSAVEMLKVTEKDSVLEIGSGLGGPARFLAHTTGCRVTGLDVQEDMHAIASELTARCGLASKITHVLGDALTSPLPAGAFDAVVSWLAIHHIPNRPLLSRRIASALRPGGQLYIEDLYTRGPYSPEDRVDVNETLHGTTMTSKEEYERDLRDAGFTDIRLIDMTEEWGTFCAGRAAGWQGSRDRHVRVHGEDTYARLERFFLTVTRLFANGGLGGVRILATKPS